MPVDLASWLSFHHQALPAVVSLCDANAIRRPGREESGGDLARSPPFSLPNSQKPKLGDHHRFPRQHEKKKHSGLRLPLFSSPPVAACFIFRVSSSDIPGGMDKRRKKRRRRIARRRRQPPPATWRRLTATLAPARTRLPTTRPPATARRGRRSSLSLGAALATISPVSLRDVLVSK